MEHITAYFEHLRREIQQSSWVIHDDLTFRQIDEYEGYIKGILHLYGGFALSVAEYVTISEGHYNIIKYRFQLLTPDNQPVVRWDNAPHHKELSTYPFHKHDQQGALHTSPPMEIPCILRELHEILGSVPSRE